MDSPTDESGPWTSGLLISLYPSSSGSLDMETFGSPKFPSYPLKSMPWSQTPGGDLDTCHGASRSAAFRALQGVGFHLHSQAYPMTTTIPFSGLNTEPGFLLRPASYSGCPACTWTSLPSGWLTFARVGLSHLRSTHWITITNFIPILRGFPRFRAYLGTRSVLWYARHGRELMGCKSPCV